MCIIEGYTIPSQMLTRRMLWFSSVFLGFGTGSDLM